MAAQRVKLGTGIYSLTDVKRSVVGLTNNAYAPDVCPFRYPGQLTRVYTSRRTFSLLVTAVSVDDEEDYRVGLFHRG